MLYLLVVRVFGSAAEKWYLLTPLGWGKLVASVLSVIANELTWLIVLAPVVMTF